MVTRFPLWNRYTNYASYTSYAHITLGGEDMPTEALRTMTKVIPAFKARQNFGQLLEEARYRGSRFIVERAGKPMAVVVGIEEWENILETLAEVDDPEYLESIKEARREIELGQTLTFEELKAELAKARDAI